MSSSALDARVGALAGRWLTPEEETLLSNELSVLDTSDLDNITFWGKIDGNDADYLIVVGQDKLKEEDDYPDQSFWFCSTTDFKLRPLTTTWATRHPEVNATTMRFTGDAATELVAAVEATEDDEETKGTAAVDAFTEKDLLACVVKDIHGATAVVPRGAFVVDPLHRVAKNVNFTGLSVAEAQDVSSYLLFRKPSEGAAVRDIDGLLKPECFLEPISATHPTGAWSVQADPCQTTVVIKSLVYPGFSFYHEPGTARFGSLYMGDGRKNEDLAFMI
ncbi:Radial spoke head protein 9-like [Hondaea fermentalgiana]|uniref:Radial spoke head protein 9 homolog n=1 Tax=Hondaea fermentalgiana TaxID=2315210 RepID=A0A2R5GVD2_9STRA|nr:Radial spoke head protein 9-like [Hondaea fermentalgiana]|eukprot:GBG34806.1 Radial spoke head protein 9-like [Hondaea fermentalgiana]